MAALKAELNYATGDREACNRCLVALQEEKLRITRTPAKLAPANKHRAPRADAPSLDGGGEESVAGAVKEAVERSLRASKGGVSPLDLLASVAGIKEEHDRALAEQRTFSSSSTEAAGQRRSEEEPCASPHDAHASSSTLACSPRVKDEEGEEECASRAPSVETLSSSPPACGEEEGGRSVMKISGLIWGSDSDSDGARTQLAPLTFPLPSPCSSLDTPPLQPLPPMTPPMHSALGASAIPTMPYLAGTVAF